MRCYDKRVLVAVGVGAAAVLAFWPQTAAVALPALLLAACPLSMLLMTRGNRGGRGCDAGRSHTSHERDAEIARLREEINTLRAQHQTRPAPERQ
ncbi:MAG: hypothetical protein ACRDPT_12180 [Streptomycetales bacterium]